MMKPSWISFKAAVVATAFLLAASTTALAGEKVRDQSPNGRFAMSLQDREDGEVTITLVETQTHKFLLKLLDSGHPYSDASRILWSPDSKRFAFYEEHRKSSWTDVYILKDSGFEEVDGPDLSECHHPGLEGPVISDLSPRNWVNPDTLVLSAHEEWSIKDKFHECNRIVTIHIGPNGKASVQSIQEQKK